MNTSNSSRLAFLDVARGLAALAVVLEHGFHQCSQGYLDWSNSHIILGQGAILTFFLISGFVIPMSLESSRSAVKFWMRRVFRLFPVYWASIGLAALYLALGGTVGLRIDLSNIGPWIANLFLLERWLGQPDVWGVSWTLHFEMSFYVVCSLLFAVRLLRRFGAKSFALALCGFAALCTVKLIRTKNPTDDLYTWSIYLAFLVGMLANRHVTGEIGRRQFYGLMACAGGMLLGIWVLNNQLYPAVATPHQLFRCTVLNGLGYGLFFLLLEMRHRTMPAALTWIGRRSYPLYLLHPFALIVIQWAGGTRDWPVSVTMATLLVASLTLAEGVHRIVEEPGIALGRSLENVFWRGRATAATQPAVVVAPKIAA